MLPCRQYDRLAEIAQGAVIEHKHLSHVLQVAQALQAQRDNSPIGKAPLADALRRLAPNPPQRTSTGQEEPT